MDTDWSDLPDDEDDVASNWGIPLDEPAPTALPANPPEASDEPPMTFPFPAYDAEPEAEFHPRLRRFGEAS